MRKTGIKSLLLIGMMAAGVLAAEPSSDSFFPMDKGAEWVYKTTNKKDNSTFDMKVVIEDPWKEGDESGPIMTRKRQTRYDA